MEQKQHSGEKEQLLVDNRKFQLIVFKLGEEEYGLHIDQIKEVVLTPNITRLPQTPSYVKGVANIRGNIISIIDLEEKFGLQNQMTNEDNREGQGREGNYTLVLESEEVKVGVLVKEVPNTLKVAMSDLEDAGNIIHDGSAEQSYIRGIVKMENRLIIMIDIFKVMNAQELSGIFKTHKQGAHV